VPAMDNLVKRRILAANDQDCMANRGENEDVDHLFYHLWFLFYFCRLWYCISGWLGFSTVSDGRVLEHITQFGSLGGFSLKFQNSLNVVWLSVAWTIWKKRKRHIFQWKEENLQIMCDRVKLQFYWWFKSKYVLLDFDYKL